MLLDELRAHQRHATPAEQAILARWSGWGAIPQVFDPGVERFAELRSELQARLSPDAYAAAARNTLNAHYSDPIYVRAMWDALGRLGFHGGQVLEPGCGSGNFIGLAPPGAQMTGVELDPTSAAIASALYPTASILAESFADTRIPEGHFDAVIGNVPFGGFVLHDPVGNPNRHSIHNHFIVKSLHGTRPGGIVMLITSRYTLDAQNPAARREMAQLADLLGAVRLPESAHRRAAGTDVITDIVVLRRRGPRDVARGEAFERSISGAITGEQRVAINEYFVAHPEHVLGQIGVGSGAYRADDLTVTASGDLATMCAHALSAITEAALAEGLAMGERGEVASTQVALVPAASRQALGHLEIAGDGFTKQAESGVEPHAVPKTQADELRQLLGLRDSVVLLLEAEATTTDDTEQIAELRGELNRRYDAYVARYGAINRCSWRATGRVDPETGKPRLARMRPRQGGFALDPHAAVVSALEIYDEEDDRALKAPILYGRVLAPRPARLGADSAPDALAICLDDLGTVDLEHIAWLLGTTSDDARAQLDTLVYEDPDSGELVTQAEYCSGNVRTKLATATVAAAQDERFAGNVTALRAVVPPDIGPGEIEARLGAPWIDEHTVQVFLQELLHDSSVRVTHYGGANWDVRGGRDGVAATSTWGTRRKTAGALVEHLLKQSAIVVYDQLDDGGRVTNSTETAAAQEKAEQISEAFSEWIWQDAERAEALVRAYNDRFNALVLRSYDGEHRVPPGVALSFRPRSHQLAAVARMVAEPAVLLAHEVGAGKTAAMAMGVMELKRLGLVTKPAIVVPNHMVDQFSREFLQIYPQAKLLVGTRQLVEGAEGRRRFVARAATSTWDAVIMSHSLFERIPLAPEHQQAYVDHELAQLRAWVQRATTERHGGVKTLERKLLQRQERLKKQIERSATDTGVLFEHTGIDYLCVDEAHAYKNLDLDSNISSVRVDGSQRSRDMDMKLDWLRSMHLGGRVVTFATATPVANSVAEAYVMQRYVRPDLLHDAGIDSFDQWAATFGEVVSGVELAPEGTSFRITQRFAKFTNVPELLTMFHVAADIKHADDLDLPTPGILAGAPEVVVVERSAELGELVAELGRRAEAVRAKAVRPEEDNMLKISSDGRAGALDLRVLGLDKPLGPTKIDVAATRIAQIYEAHRTEQFLDDAGDVHPRPGALQLVFCDLSTPSQKWNAYDELAEELAARQVPRDMIRFVHDAKDDAAKAALFAACRAGSVAVLIGSTAKMGVGTNVQARAVALHHLDCPWRPDELHQREGRILRQGNQNPEVEIVRYVTEGSFDTYMWQTVERKARFIGQLMRGRLDVREIDDIGDVALSYAEVKALAAGDPRLIEQAQTDADLIKLERLSRAWSRNHQHLERSVEVLAHTITRLEHELAQAREVRMSPPADLSGDRFVAEIAGQRYTSRLGAGQGVLRAIETRLARRDQRSEQALEPIGILGGQRIGIAAWRDAAGGVARVGLLDAPRSVIELRAEAVSNTAPQGLMLRIEHLLGRLEAMPEQLVTELASTQHEHDQALHALEVTSFPRQAELDELRARARLIAEELASKAREVPPGDAPAPPAQGSAPAPATQASAPVSIQWRQLPLVLARHHGLGLEPNAFVALARRSPVPQMLRTWEQWQRLGRQVRAGAPVVCEGPEGPLIDVADTDGSLLVPNSTCPEPPLGGLVEALQRLTPDLSLDSEPGDVHGLLQVLEALGALPNDSTIGQLATQIAAHSAAIWLGVDPGVVSLPDDFPLEHEQLFARTVERALEKLEHVRSQITTLEHPQCQALVTAGAGAGAEVVGAEADR